MDLLALVEHGESVDGNQTLERVVTAFRDSHHDYAAVTVAGRVVGICSQARARELLSGRYGFALNARSPVRDHLVDGHLQFTPDTPLRTVLEQALSRKDDAFYQDIVLVDAEDRLLGLVPTQRLVDAQSRLVRDQFELVELQRQELEEVNRSLARSLDQQLHLERQIIQREKSALLESLAGGIAHEINNKLLPITGHAELMLLEAESMSPDFLRSCETVRDSAFESAKIIRQLLQLSKPSPAEMLPLDLRQVVTDALKFVNLRVRESGTAMGVALPEAEVLVLGDATQLKQVIVNLAINALDALEQIASPRLEFRLVSTAGVATLVVADHGQGIAPENLTRIFDPFYTTKDPNRGTGLGLSVTLSIIKQHRGEIRVESVVGHGTTFTIDLPLGDVPNGAKARPVPTTAAIQMEARASILVIDDERPAALLLERVLKARFGCRADVVSDGRMAIDRLRHGQYAVIISDVRMPAVNGVQLFEWLLANRPDLVPRVMFTTGDADQSELNARIATLNVPVLQKPFTIEELERQVRRVLLESEASHLRS